MKINLYDKLYANLFPEQYIWKQIRKIINQANTNMINDFSSIVNGTYNFYYSNLCLRLLIENKNISTNMELHVGNTIHKLKYTKFYANEVSGMIYKRKIKLFAKKVARDIQENLID